MKKYKVTVLINKPIYLDYIVEAENEEEAINSIDGLTPINKEECLSSENDVVSVEVLDDV